MELKVNLNLDELEKIKSKYKKIQKYRKSALYEAKQLYGKLASESNYQD